jgi:drug/metabolite transporter (DMT)-like permease
VVSVVCLVGSWVAMAELLQGLQVDYPKPWAITFAVHSGYALLLPVWLALRHRRLAAGRELPVPPRVLARGAAAFAVLSAVIAATWYVSLPQTTVGVNNAVYQSQSAFVFVLSVVLLGEAPAAHKMLGLCLSLAGIAVIAGGSAGKGAGNTTAGIAWVLVSTILYSTYEVLYARLTTAPAARAAVCGRRPATDATEAAGPLLDGADHHRAVTLPVDRAEMAALILTSMGLTTFVALWPVFFVAAATGVEQLARPSAATARLLALNAVLDTIYNLALLLGIALLSPLTMSLATVLVVPAGLIADYLLHSLVPDGWALAGSALLCAGFLVMTLCERRLARVRAATLPSVVQARASRRRVSLAAVALFVGVTEARDDASSRSFSVSVPRLKSGAAQAWSSAVKNLNATHAAASAALYRRAWEASNESDYDAYWEGARVSIAAALIGDAYPSRERSKELLRRELNGTTDDENPVGRTAISQLAAFSLLDTTSFQWAARAWGHSAMKARPTVSGACPRPLPVNGTRPLHVGYLSSNFGDHPIGHHIGAPLRLHDRSRFVVTCIATRSDGSAHARRLQSYCDTWAAVEGPKGVVPALLRLARPLDILIALDGWDLTNSMSALAELRHSCGEQGPLVLSFFGFLGTTGATFIDGVVTDAVATPGVEGQQQNTERLVLRHPTTFFVTDYAQLRAGEASEAALPTAQPEAYAFCSLNQLLRVGPAQLTSWLRILIRTSQPQDASAMPADGPPLHLLAYPPLAPEGIRRSIAWAAPRLLRAWEERLAQLGVAHEVRVSAAGEAGSNATLAAFADALLGRLRFTPLLPFEEHIAWKRAHCALGLDPFRYNGHTGTADMLAAGVPVLTLVSDEGAGMAGRAAASLLAAAGAPPSFVTSDVAAYEQSAVDHHAQWGVAGAWRPRVFDAAWSAAWVRDFEELLVGAVGSEVASRAALRQCKSDRAASKRLLGPPAPEGYGRSLAGGTGETAIARDRRPSPRPHR